MTFPVSSHERLPDASIRFDSIRPPCSHRCQCTRRVSQTSGEWLADTWVELAATLARTYNPLFSAPYYLYVTVNAATNAASDMSISTRWATSPHSGYVHLASQLEVPCAWNSTPSDSPIAEIERNFEPGWALWVHASIISIVFKPIEHHSIVHPQIRSKKCLCHKSLNISSSISLILTNKDDAKSPLWAKWELLS